MTHFKLIEEHDNGNEIDGTPGCPHVQSLRRNYLCSRALSAHLTKIQPARNNPKHLTAYFRKHNPDAHFENLTCAPGCLNSGRWYIQTLDF